MEANIDQTKFSGLLDAEKRPTTLRSGDLIFFDEEDGSIGFIRNGQSGGNKLYFGDGFDKCYYRGLGENIIWLVVCMVEAVTGLKTRLKPASLGKTVYEFW